MINIAPDMPGKVTVGSKIRSENIDKKIFDFISVT